MKSFFKEFEEIWRNLKESEECGVQAKAKEDVFLVMDDVFF